MTGRILMPHHHAGSDVVMTPPALARRIVEHFQPAGRTLEPCRGDGAFFDALPEEGRDWCEIREGRDFLHYAGPPVAWIVTNPPFSLLRLFLRKSMQVADNVVFLCFVNAFWMRARLDDITRHRFSLREVVLVDTPPPPWPASGFQVGAVHLARGRFSTIKVTDWRKTG